MELRTRRRYLLKVVLLLLLIQCGFGQKDLLNSSTDMAALLGLRSSLGLRNRDWGIKTNPCSDWTGVLCESGRVVGISVSGLRRTHSGRLSPRFAVDALANLTSLVSFNASGFSLPGSIPDWFGLSLVGLEVLDLSSCSIVGSIPFSIGNFSKLTVLCLSGNSLTGIMPSSIGQLSQLTVLDLSRNLLTGSIPSCLSSLNNLTRLELASNYLSGPIPPGFDTLSKLFELNISDNSLISSIPSELGSLSALIVLDLSKNSLSGALPVSLKGLRGLKKMDIGDNGLEGPLPDELFSSLVQLEDLVLRGNKLDGGLNSDLLSHPKLQFLDLSNNNFTGPLPSFVPNRGAAFNFSNNVLYGPLTLPLKSNASIDLSGNYFQGVVHSKSHNVILRGNCLDMVPDQRSFEDCSLFYSERNLNFEGLGKGNRDELERHPVKNNRLKFIMMVGLFGGLAFVVVFVLILVVVFKFCGKGKANKRGKANVGPVPDGDSPSLAKDPVYFAGLGDSFTYDQMLQCTGDFSKDNLIKNGHSGDLYKGFLEGGLPVVIKKVNMQYLKNETYSTELDFFSKVSHMRFVPFLGHCFEREDEKLFVYKCMPNGDLANCLQNASSSENDNVQSLDWIIRLKIAIGAAEALSNLHHECSPPLVHRDIQASSILLDDKFEVRLGSLSEACVLEGDQHQNVFRRLRRKQQSSEQCSSGSSPASCSLDIYCFGKVLLELVTGKLGISKADDATTKEWLEHTLANISIHDKELVTKIVDPSLMIDDDLLEEVWAMAIIARSCLNPKPSRRPLMRYILKALENPLKVVREESSSSGRLRATSSRRSWSAAFHGSWRHSSSDVHRESGSGGGSGSKQPGRINSHGSCGYDFSSSNKRLSSEIVPEPEEFRDIERQD